MNYIFKLCVLLHVGEDECHYSEAEENSEKRNVEKESIEIPSRILEERKRIIELIVERTDGLYSLRRNELF